MNSGYGFPSILGAKAECVPKSAAGFIQQTSGGISSLNGRSALNSNSCSFRLWRDARHHCAIRTLAVQWVNDARLSLVSGFYVEEFRVHGAAVEQL